MEVKFTPEHKVVNDLFAREIRYIIPEYQRPYSWECVGKSDQNNQIIAMWDDLLEYFEEGKRETYFFGSMVLIGNGNRQYQVVDGQQRLTSLVLLFAAFKCFAQEIVKKGEAEQELLSFAKKVVSLVDELIFNEKLFGAVSVEKKVKIEKSEGFDFDAALTSSINCEKFNPHLFKGAKQEHLNVAARYFNNKEYFITKLEEKFLDKNGNFTKENAQKLNEFLDFIKNRISVVRILTDKFEIAYHIFEILNNRGLPLSNKDLFRNFLLKEFDALKSGTDISPVQKWAVLEQEYDMRDEFLSRWVESVNARQQQYSAFNDLKDIYEKQYTGNITRNKIEIFYEDIKRDLGYFTTLINNEVSDPFLKAKLNVLLNGGNNRYTLNFLLALWRRFEGNEQHVYDFVNAYEIFLLHKILLGRFVSGPVYEAIKNLKNNTAKDKIIEKLAPTDLKLGVRMAILEGNLDNESAKLLIAKCTWLQEAHTAGNDVVEQKLLFDRATLEHIIPQKPEPGTNWLRDFSNEFRSLYTYRLGNMTLLTGRQNSAARNYDFSQKRTIYSKTKLSLTQEIAQKQHIDEMYINTRHDMLSENILQDLGL